MNPADVILLVAAVIAALTTIGVFVLKIYRVAKRIDGALGVDKQGRSISDRLERVEHQLFPNGGSSLTDKINRIEHEQKQMQGQMGALERILETLLRKEGAYGRRASDHVDGSKG